MDLSNLRPPKGATHSKKRIGRGQGSGQGVQAGRGHKGAKSRSGFKHKRGFEGGQMPLHRRVPKRGFHNPFRQEFEVVNLDALGEKFDAGTEVTPELLRERPAVDFNVWPARVERRVFMGDSVHYFVAWAGGTLSVRTLPLNLFEEGDEVFVHVEPRHCVFVE